MTSPDIERLFETASPSQRDLASRLRDVIVAQLDPGFEEVVQGRLLSYVVPKSLYPPGYHANPSQPLPLASLGVQKRHVALYLFGLYIDPPLKAWFVGAWEASGVPLDLGQSCLRMRSVDHASLDTIAALFARWKVPAYVEQYERSLAAARA